MHCMLLTWLLIPCCKYIDVILLKLTKQAFKTKINGTINKCSISILSKFEKKHVLWVKIHISVIKELTHLTIS